MTDRWRPEELGIFVHTTVETSLQITELGNLSAPKKVRSKPLPATAIPATFPKHDLTRSQTQFVVATTAPPRDLAQIKEKPAVVNTQIRVPTADEQHKMQMKHTSHTTIPLIGNIPPTNTLTCAICFDHKDTIRFAQEFLGLAGRTMTPEPVSALVAWLSSDGGYQVLTDAPDVTSSFRDARISPPYKSHAPRARGGQLCPTADTTLCHLCRETGQESARAHTQGAVVAERLACSPPTRANRAQSPAGSHPGFRMWESCRTMPLLGGFSWGSPVSPSLSFRSCSILTSITIVGSQDLAVKSRPNTFTQSSLARAHTHTHAHTSARVTETGYGTERLDCSPPTKANWIQSPAGSLRIFASGSRARRCVGWRVFSEISPPPPTFHSEAAIYSPHFCLLYSQYLAVKSHPNLFTLFTFP
ncbi:hypothetical protein PR048_031688 [Dryococelus australis]|uniref:Uncharacterized protein n=1 Tax=Dryococelus australis TaxID=614101 RepID=A0ABQ9G8X1_9NEOP|nr:hypothetical protein PR048_031688 [Dryococelus australis]